MSYVVVCLLSLFGTLCSFCMRLPYAGGILLIYFVPGIAVNLYMNSWRDACWHFIAVTIVALPFALIVDFIGVMSHLWFVPRSIVAWRVLGVIPVEDPLWLIAALYMVTSLHQGGTRQRKPSQFRRRLRQVAVASATCIGLDLILDLTVFRGIILQGPWTYAALGTMFFGVPVIISMAARRLQMSDVLPVVTCFFLCTLFFEINAALLSWWTFPWSYIAVGIPIFSLGRVPIEEILFVGIVGPLAGISIYDGVFGL